MKTCLKQIDLDTNGIVSTYCYLKDGHEGPCLPEEPFKGDWVLLIGWWKRNHPEKLKAMIAEILK